MPSGTIILNEVWRWNQKSDRNRIRVSFFDEGFFDTISGSHQCDTGNGFENHNRTVGNSEQWD